MTKHDFRLQRAHYAQGVHIGVYACANCPRTMRVGSDALTFPERYTQYGESIAPCQPAHQGFEDILKDIERNIAARKATT
jgi:hypothetical protein